jgi:hypothetical protein
MSDWHFSSSFDQSPDSRWQQLVIDISQTSTSISLNQLICYLDYAVHSDELTLQQALAVMEGDKQWLLNIECEQYRNAAISAFEEFTGSNQSNGAKYILFYGSRYDFRVIYDEIWFEIVATHRQSNTRSKINTLNYILSAFDIDLEEDNAENSHWCGTSQQVQIWVEAARSLFADKLFVPLLEQALDKDRKEGEWESD